MTDGNELAARLRAATPDLHAEPIRPKRVARLARRRAFAVVIGLAVAGIAAVLVISGGLLAGKAAVDPRYHPPFTQREAKLAVKFDEPHAARGHVPLRHFLATTKQSTAGMTPEELRSEGFAFGIRVELIGYRRSPTRVEWSVLDAVDRHRMAVPLHATAPQITPTSSDETVRVAAWVPYPGRSGKFFVRFRLVDARGRLIATRDSAPFIALRPDFFRTYRTKTYVASVPVGWRSVENYGPEPEHRRVTLLEGPHKTLLDIDTHLNWSGDYARSAQVLEGAVGPEKGYRRLVFQRESLGTGRAFEWSFRLGHIYKTDIFFKRGRDGFAILAVGTANDYSELRAIARSVARSIRSAAPGS